jgi:antitoxin YefM
MTTTYKLNANQLSEDILRSIKEAFKDKEIEIVVSDSVDETEYLFSTEANKKHLYKSKEELAEGKGIAMTLVELQEKYLK